MNARLRVRLLQPAPQAKPVATRTERQVIDQVIAGWKVAGWKHLVNGTTPAGAQ